MAHRKCYTCLPVCFWHCTHSTLPFFLFYSGTGKTFIVKVVASVTQSKLFHIKPSIIQSKWKGNSEAAASIIFKLARRTQKTIIFFDEADGFFAKRDGSDDANITRALMEELTAVKRRHSCLVVLSTNKPWNIDDAVHSRSRSIYVSLPSMWLHCFFSVSLLSLLIL